MIQGILPYIFRTVFTIILVFATALNIYPQPARSVSGDENLISKNEISTGSTTSKNSTPDIEVIRKRIIDDLLAPAVDATAIRKLIGTLQADGSWPDINYKDTSKTAFQNREHLEHMEDLSRAYKKPASPFYQDMNVKKIVLAALDFWLAHDFICENWWWNEMGTPNLIINTLLLLDTDLSDQQRTAGLKIANRANLEAFGARPGGDLIQIAGMLGKQGLFKRDETIVERVVKAMASEIKISTGRGLQPDMSFHHRTDNVISTLTYGTGYASSFAYWAVKTAGTKFTLPENAVKLLIDYYLDGISKSMAFGKYPDLGAKNRDLSRKGTLSPAGIDLPSNLMVISNYRKAELDNLVKIRNGTIVPNLQWNRYFWNSSYFTHQRPKWFSSVRMHSSRQNNMEEAYNDEGLKNHHFADGSNFIIITGKEYVDVFPVWDWQKIPGATIVQKPSVLPFKQIPKKGLTNFVGAVSNGTYGAAATDFKSVHDPLQARKAWFYFNDEYVCLGTGIHSTSEYPVATTLNQCNLDGAVTAQTGGKTEVLKKGTHSLNAVNWIQHNKVAYLFPEPVDISLTNQTATGSWREISHQDWATEEPVQKELFTAWINHGVKPSGAGYAYIVVPDITTADLKPYQQKNAISIISNTPQVQAVHHRLLQLTEAIFYQQGMLQLSEGLSIKAEQPCMLMVEMEGSQVKKISVADPTQLLKKLSFTVYTPLKGKNGHLKPDMKSTLLEIILPDGGDAGKSITVKFGK